MWPGMEPKSIEVDRSCPVHAASLDRVLGCAFQKQSAVLSLVGPSSSGSREASTEFSWAIEFNVLFEWFKSTAKLRFQVRCSVCSTRSWFGKWLKLSQKLFSVLPMWIVFLCGCVPQQWRQKVSLHCWAQPFGWSYEIWWRILMPVYKKGTRARDFNIHKLSWGTSLLRFYSLSWHLASCAVLRLLFKTI